MPAIRPTSPSGSSLYSSGAPVRLACAAVLSGLVWLAIAWAMAA